MKKKKSNIFTGGSRIELVNETFPFSKLIVDPQKIILKTTFSGTLESSSKELIAVKEVFYVPVLAQGIRIVQDGLGINPNLFLENILYLPIFGFDSTFYGH